MDISQKCRCTTLVYIFIYCSYFWKKELTYWNLKIIWRWIKGVAQNPGNFVSEQGASAALNRTFAASLLLNAAAAGPKSYVNLTLSRHLVLDDRHQAGTCLQPLWQDSLWICRFRDSGSKRARQKGHLCANSIYLFKLLVLCTAFAKISKYRFRGPLIS